MQGKVAIVTGAAGGIGEACVRALGAKGVKVLGTGRSADKLQALKEELAGSVEFDFVAVDVTADDAPEKIVNGAIEKFGRLDILVNNAGSFNFGPVDQTSDEMLDEVLDISLRAPFRLCREALKHMGQGASIQFIGSTWGCRMRPPRHSHQLRRAFGRAHGHDRCVLGSRFLPSHQPRTDPDRARLHRRGHRQHGGFPRLGRGGLRQRPDHRGRWRHFHDAICCTRGRGRGTAVSTGQDRTGDCAGARCCRACALAPNGPARGP